jgi:hypothetical protein
MADLTTIQNRLTALEADLLACQTETEPTPPLNCVATLDGPQTSATITFMVPTSDGGSVITGYEAVSTPGGFSASGAGLSLVVTGLDGANEEYTFEVRATNAVGHSLPCVTNAVGTNAQVMALQTAAKFVMAGTNGVSFLSSNNAQTWIGMGDPTFFVQFCYGIAYDGVGRWVAVGFNTATGNTRDIAYYDTSVSLRWSSININYFGGGNANGGYCVAYGGGRWVAGGGAALGSGKILSSTDGALTWTNVGGGLGSYSVLGVAYDGVGLWMSGMNPGTGAHTLGDSPDGVTWTGRGKTVFSGLCNDMAYGGGRWIAVGQGINSIAYSTDGGATWTGDGQSVFSRGNGIAYDGVGRWLAVGQGATDTIAYSDDGGASWTGVGNSVFATNGSTVAHNGVDQWTVGGPSQASPSPFSAGLANSTDGGLTWTPVPTADALGGNFNTIAYDHLLPL